ncbi:hypothetical protein [uncultured Tateyamaria sp.]|uniref:hypothetical protein n=1 Tax=Tateyamaria sp. 1078 TaxID=3417464 RepID=UPI00262ED630|nr:hypothetical protein [uncultured Tateyamaria sp.]
MELVADASRILLAVVAVVFSLLQVLRGRPVLVAVFGLMIAGAALDFLLHSSGALPTPALIINVGTAGVLGWICIFDPTSNVAASLRNDPWVRHWKTPKN